MRFMMAFVVFFAVASAQADIIFSPGVSYFKIEDEDSTGATSEVTASSYDFKLAYLHPSGLVLGGMYSMMSVNEEDGFAAGATIGFSHYSGFYALFTYHLMAEQDVDATTTFTDGMGPQIDIGWIFPITHMFHIGPQLTYRSVNYKKVEAAGVSADTDYTRSSMMPYLTLWFRF